MKLVTLFWIFYTAGMIAAGLSICWLMRRLTTDPRKARDE